VSKALRLYWQALDELRQDETYPHRSFGVALAAWVAQIPLPAEYRAQRTEIIAGELEALLQRLSDYPEQQAILARRVEEAFPRS